MNQIVVDGNVYDPYFMLDVVSEDTEQFITKSFRKKAKTWHPDKIAPKDSKNSEHVKRVHHHFKVLVQSYEYIINKKSSVNHNKREVISVPKNDNIKVKSIDNSDELGLFNDEFEKTHIKTPNDFGYATRPRMKDTKEYDNFDYKPEQLFKSKNFNPNDFNKLFEYQKETYNGESTEVGLYNQSTDGFNAYNGGDLNGMANVSSYNGIMIVGDTFGQNGMGYYDTNFSDYKKSFDVPKNPDKYKVPDDFESTSSKPIKPLTKQETQKQLDLHMEYRNLNNEKGGKQNFKLLEQQLIQQQEIEIRKKIENDKNLILQYQDMYGDKSLIQAAMDNKLVTSADYVSEKTIGKRFQTTNL